MTDPTTPLPPPPLGYPASAPEGTPATVAEAPVVTAADFMTEQEKDQTSELHGVGPKVESQPSPGPVETMEDLGIGPRDPYPSGNPGGVAAAADPFAGPEPAPVEAQPQ
jgi:hypothetical protein